MPSLTSDGQSLILDGHRLWLVSGSVCYAKTPRGLWAERLLAAKQAGLNCIETPVVWSLHEPRPGALTFDGELDIHTFVKQVGLLKMHCILRLGPYIGEGLDLGGMPAWLVERAGGRLRCAAPEFLQAASRFLAAVCERVRDLQATARRNSGPLVLVQNEHQWFCGDEDQAERYLGELARFSRENGINVPIANCNNLYAGAEGEIDGWAGSSHLFANLRQLRSLRPDQPRLALGLTLGHRGVWGRPLGDEVTPRSAMRRIAEVLAAGGQYNIDPFHGGTTLGFLGGRGDEAPDAFFATSAMTGAPLSEAGERGPLFNAVRRISTFASQFGRVFAALDAGYQPVTMSLDEAAAQPARASKSRAPSAGPADRLVALERRGSQGSIVLVFASESGAGVHRGSIVLPDGSALPIDLGDQAVAWALLGTHLVGRSTLDYCNLCAFGVVGSVFVCFGPAGAPGVLSINGSAFEVVVPDGDEPHIEHHEGVSIVVCNQRTIDSTFLSDQGVFIGASGLDAAGRPRAQSGFRRITAISPDGQASVIKPNPAPSLRPSPAFSAWARASCQEYLAGASERFAAIDGPASLDRLGAPLGYGWLRLRWKSSSTRTIKAGFFESADRLHLFVGGRPLSVLGLGPGAEDGPARLPVRTGENTLVVLADNLGRASAGARMGEHKGLYGQVWETASMRPGTPRLERGDPVAPLSFRSPTFGLEESDLTDGRRVTWRFQHRKRTPVFVRFGAHTLHGLLMLNGKPIAVLSPGGGECVTLEPESTARGGNVVQAAIVGDAEASLPSLREAVRFFEGTECVSARAHWAFAKWERPAAGRFKPPARGAGDGANTDVRGIPTWWRATFSVAGVERPLFLDAAGLSKGQMYLNGVNIGRYFVATASGRAVPPQGRYYLPEPWLKVGQANELVLFDEHGFSPERCRLAYSSK